MPPPIRVVRAPTGALTYLVAVPPEALPPVRARDLLAAWDAAREAAAAERWGPPRRLVFHRGDGAPTELAIADPDAGCWAEAVDAIAGLETLGGLALCLRLLALVEALTRLRWLVGMFEVTTSGIELHPALLRAAAGLALDGAARFDAAALRALLSRALPTRLDASSPTPLPAPAD